MIKSLKENDDGKQPKDQNVIKLYNPSIKSADLSREQDKKTLPIINRGALSMPQMLHSNPQITYSSSESLNMNINPNKIVLPPLSSLNKGFLTPMSPTNNIPYNSRVLPLGAQHAQPKKLASGLLAADQQYYTINQFHNYEYKPKLTSPEQYLSQINKRQFQQQSLSSQHNYIPYYYSANKASKNTILEISSQANIIPSPMVTSTTASHNQFLQNRMPPHELKESVENVRINKNIKDETKDNRVVLNESSDYRSLIEQQFAMTRKNSVGSANKEKKLKKKTNSNEKLVNIKCPFCHRVFNRQSSYQNHKNTHTGARPFMCKVCGKTFNASPNLSRHKKIHEKEKSSQQQEHL